MAEAALAGPPARRGRRRSARVGRLERVVLVGLPLVLLLAGWEWLARAQVVGSLFFAGPLDVARALWTLALDGELWRHARISLTELALGVGAATLVGVPLGLALGGIRPLEGVLAPYVAALYAAPRVAFFPLIALWFGTGLTSKALLVFITVVFPILINSWASVKTVDPVLLKAARSFGANRLQLFTKIVLPHALPFVVTGLRIGSGIGLLAVYVAETFGADGGLGYLAHTSGFAFQADKVFAGVIGLAVLGIALNQSLTYLERHLAPWRKSQDG